MERLLLNVVSGIWLVEDDVQLASDLTMSESLCMYNFIRQGTHFTLPRRYHPVFGRHRVLSKQSSFQHSRSPVGDVPIGIGPVPRQT